MPASQTSEGQTLVGTTVSVLHVDHCCLSSGSLQGSWDPVPIPPACLLPALLPHHSAHLQTPEPAAVPNREHQLFCYFSNGILYFTSTQIILQQTAYDNDIWHLLILANMESSKQEYLGPYTTFEPEEMMNYKVIYMPYSLYQTNMPLTDIYSDAYEHPANAMEQHDSHPWTSDVK